MIQLGLQLAVLSIFSSTLVQSSELTSVDYRLPNDVVPVYYDLKILTDVDNKAYNGTVDITLKPIKETTNIVLHTTKVDIIKEGIKLISIDYGVLPLLEITETPETEQLKIVSSGLLVPGKEYRLVIPFSRKLSNDLVGFYTSSYVDQTNNNTEWLATTQFEAEHARKAFPCFDEPALKASFRITLGRSNEYKSISNMPLKTTIPISGMDGWYWDEYERSVPMSTYLVAFIVFKFHSLDSPPGLSNTAFKIWARKDAIDQTEYASIVGPKVLSYYEEYFAVDFPLPKQDMVAIPDFSAGAMENWGCITYRETALLYDKEQSSRAAKNRVASVIAHELAHQWFGNLVTMQWWEDLWLNEGFATYVAAIGVHHIEPTWNELNTQIVNNLKTVFRLDSLKSSHAVSVPIDNPKRINEIFDAISYKKGCNIIRMMSVFLGEDAFRQGLTNYLKKHSYKNAKQDDLWESLTEAAHDKGSLSKDMTVKQIMDTWTKQVGYPILTVKRSYEDMTMDITQKRYLALTTEGTKQTENPSSWWIPLKILRESKADANIEKTPIMWLSNTEGALGSHEISDLATANEWIVFNVDLLAIYRVNYDERNWQLLSDALNSDKFESIPTLNRVQLLNDVFELSWSNILPYKTALEMANYLDRETDILPLESGLDSLNRIGQVLLRSVDYGAYQKFIRKIITPIYHRVGGIHTKKIQDPDEIPGLRLQVESSRWACRMKVPGCQNNAIEMFQEWMETADPDENNPIPVDLRDTVYCTGIQRGSVEHWAFLYQRYRRANVAAAKTSMMYALACTNEVWLLKRYLEWCLEGGPNVKRADVTQVFGAIARSPQGYYLAKPFLYNRINDIHKFYNTEGRRIGDLVQSIGSQITEQIEFDEFLEWTKNHTAILSDSKLGVEQAIEQARINVEWLKKNREDVVRQLREISM